MSITSIKPYPPYGKELAELLSWGCLPRNDVFMFVGQSSWRKAKAFADSQFVLCLPHDRKPEDFTWPVQGCAVLMFDTGEMAILDIENFSYLLLKSKAEIVRAVLVSGTMIIFRRLLETAEPG